MGSGAGSLSQPPNPPALERARDVAPTLAPENLFQLPTMEPGTEGEARHVSITLDRDLTRGLLEDVPAAFTARSTMPCSAPWAAPSDDVTRPAVTCSST